MSEVVIKVESLSKQYRLGLVGTGTLVHDINIWWHKIRGKENPNLKIDATKGESNDLIWALKDINFEVKRGEVLGIIGKNGAGKSTLLKILSKVTQPATGSIKIKGRIASLLEVGTGFHPELTGRENVFLNGAIMGMTKAEIARKFDEIVDFSGVEKYIDTPVKRYSSGMYVRLAFAVAAHLEPEILIVDEVLAVGDAEFQKKCLGKMKDVSGQGRTVLFVSHNMGVISAICTKAIWLEKGIIKMNGPTEKVITTYLDPEEKQFTRTIKNEMRVRGNKAVEFFECTILNLSEAKKNFFVIGEDIRLDFLVESKTTEDVGFWLIIRDREGKPILCSHQKDYTKQNISPGRYVVSYQTNGISLLPGNYFVTAGVLNYSYTNFFEWVENCQSFEVLPAFKNGNKYDGRLGVVMQAANWEVVKHD
ncbi:MAG: ABC transporter ATP-binding protein [Bacteroidetes bacterium]|nr:ABC transporter ATP-binding protein [Bacteroidota bacterium]